MTRYSRLLPIVFVVLVAYSLLVPPSGAVRSPQPNTPKLRQSRLPLTEVFDDSRVVPRNYQTSSGVPSAPSGTVTVKSSYPPSLDPPGNYVPGNQTFILMKQPFTSTDCTTGAGAVTTVTGVNSSSGHTVNVSSGSIGFQAPALSDQNGTFAGWSPVSGNFGNFTTWAGHTNGICVASTVTDTFRAAYNAGVVVLDSTCTNPKTLFNLGETVCGRLYGDPQNYCNPPNRSLQIAFKDPSSVTRNSPALLTTDLSTQTFVLPSTNTQGTAGDNRGHWLAQVVRTCDANPLGSSGFLVHNPADLAADIQISKSAFAGGVHDGGTMQFDIRLFNFGPDTAVNASWSDIIPATMTFHSLTRIAGPAFNCTTPAVGANGTITCSTASLAAGNTNSDPAATGIFRVVLKVNSGVAYGTVITNTTTGTSGTNDTLAGNNSSSAVFSVLNICSYSNGCPADINVAADTMCSGVPGKVVTFSNPSTVGSCGALTVFPTSGSCFPTGTTTVSIQDGTGNASCNFRITVTGSPTAAGSEVTGTIVDDQGTSIEGATINLSGSESRKTITDASGRYLFENVTPNGFFNVTPSRVNYEFTPSMRSFSQIGQSTEAVFTANPNGQSENPLGSPEYFVRQHYVDFLGREPDEAGFNFWSDQILECGADAVCVERRTINVSAAYFVSIEFQQSGGLVDGLYRASYGRRPLYAEFVPDAAVVARDVIVGRDDWAQQLANNKEAFVATFVERPAFHAAYDGMDANLFVDTLINHTGVAFTTAERDGFVNGLATGTRSRAQVLRSIIENQRFVALKQNEMFVMMEYFGYLRRDPDPDGYQFWLNKLNEFNGNFEQAEMVKAFIVSGEYRDRFPR